MKEKKLKKFKSREAVAAFMAQNWQGFEVFSGTDEIYLVRYDPNRSTWTGRMKKDHPADYWQWEEKVVLDTIDRSSWMVIEHVEVEPELNIFEVI